MSGPVHDPRFEPSAERGRRLDSAMRERLAHSLDHVFGRIGGDLGITPADGERLVAAIRSRRQSPQLFGTYYDMVLAVERDDLADARRLATELRERVDAPLPRLWANSLGDRPEPDIERYRRLLLPRDIRAAAPNADDLTAASRRIDAAMNLLTRGFPGMAAEIRALIFEVVIGVGPEEPDLMTFDGSSCYMLWGAILLNARGQSTVLDTALALAHESGHNLLFGKCVRGPLIENDDDEVYSHPLRQDPRPMDGVFHAAYVIARMCQTLERLLESGVLDDEQRDAAIKDLAIQRASFGEADEVIRANARLTDVGRDAIEAARAQMAVAA